MGGDLMDPVTLALAKKASASIYTVIASVPVHYARDVKWGPKSSVRTSLTSPVRLTVNIGNNGYMLSQAIDIDITAAGSWDSIEIDYTQAANRAGKDFYIYACQPVSGTEPVFAISANSTVPTGYTADNSRKIGGFHCLCVSVGTISGHTLTGYVAGDILPASVWDLLHRPVSSPEGMVYDSGTDRWVDIYLASVSSGNLVSVNRAVIADGVSSPAFHWYKGSQWMARIKKRLLTQHEFVSASLGANQGTNIAGYADPNTTTGHTDTAGRRMISNIGCEDICGVLWQWGAEAGGPHDASVFLNAYNSYDADVAGQHYNAPNRAIFGGYWDRGPTSGSRGSSWDAYPLLMNAHRGLRGCAEPLRGVI